MSRDTLKSIALVVLVFLCTGLAVVAGMGGMHRDVGKDIIPAVPACAKGEIKRLSPLEVIALAPIEGIALSTKPEEVEAAAKKAGFTCARVESAPGEVQWSCTHGKIKEASLSIGVRGGKIHNIYRNGEIAAADMASVMDIMDDLKARLNTRENVRFSQSEDVYSFSVSHKTEAGEQSLDYNIMNRRMRDEKDPMKFTVQQIYTASLSVR